jgi:DNA-binding GntR family transcriptional regulator
MAEPDDLIYLALSKALLAGQLPPGAQLVETRVASLFGVSRERVRKVLHRLGHERLIDVIPQRGAFVSAPTLSQAREVYEARRIIEGGVAARLAGQLTSSQIQQLRKHGEREALALKAGDRGLSIELSRQFHLLLGEFCGNAFVIRELQELVSRTSMLEAFFEPETASQCGCNEHHEIVDALAAGEAALAIRMMHVHLSLIETRLRPEPPGTRTYDMDVLLTQAWEAVQAATLCPDVVEDTHSGG